MLNCMVRADVISDESWTVLERHRRWSADGTYGHMFVAVKKAAGASTADLDALLSVDSTSAKVHQHAAGAPKALKKGWVG